MHLKGALRDSSNKKLRSVLKQFADFAKLLPSRVLFIKPVIQGSIEHSAHNEWTLILFNEHLHSRKSKKTGKVIKAKSITGYVSMVRAHFSREYGFEVAPGATQLPAISRAMVREDSILAIRKKRIGVRGAHLTKAFPVVFPKAIEDSPQAVNEAAMVSTAWQVLGRGGEMTSKELVRSDIQWVRASKGTQAHAILWLRPLKNYTEKGAQKCPNVIAKGGTGGSNTYHLLKRLVRLDPVAKEKRKVTPLFRAMGSRGISKTKAINRKRFITLLKLVAKVNGLNPNWITGHSARIGGATDLLAAIKGDAKPSLKARGRWASDIGDIYARVTRRKLLEYSRLMQKGKGKTLEEIYPRFTQPTCNPHS